MQRIWVGLSGGVDSAVAAALLVKQGYAVEGVTLRLHSNGAEADIDDARRVCDVLGIAHRVLDCTSLFDERVVAPFVAEYLAGRTPNPCVLCNAALKFGALLDAALAAGADGVATGHYARVAYDEQEDRLALYCRGGKDQSYVLCRLTQQQLAHVWFPLDGMDKATVRRLAGEYGLPVADKGDSMDVCFIPDGDHAAFIEAYTGRPLASGPIVDETGRVLGTHRGIARYTVGQRKGLGVAGGRPLYVVRIDAHHNTVVLGEEGRQLCGTLCARQVNYVSIAPPAAPIRVQAKIRYQAAPADALLTPLDAQTARLDFDVPQRAVTPGQTVVFYDGDRLLGGGFIAEADVPELAESVKNLDAVMS